MNRRAPHKRFTGSGRRCRRARLWSASLSVALFLAEAVELYDLATGGLVRLCVGSGLRRLRIGHGRRRRNGLVLARRSHRLARSGRTLLRLRGFLGAGILLELQAELDRRIEEAFDRGKRHGHSFGYAAEGHADLETGLGYFKIPELVLQDDRHLLGILRAHARR